MRVYYFTSEEFAILDLCNHMIKVSTISDLNDPYELMGMELKDKEFRKFFRQKRNEFAKQFGIVCFSKSWHNPVLWSHYGDKHRGICLGFDVPDSLLVNVNYYPSMELMETSIASDNKLINLDKFRALITRKFQDWAYEEEARILVKLDSCIFDIKKKLYFLHFSDNLILSEVIIGPQSAISQMEIAGLIKPNFPGLIIRKARLAFRSYKVVNNLQYKIVKV